MHVSAKQADETGFVDKGKINCCDKDVLVVYV
jgi:hypothetical protein